jgi:hypothetical protein
MCSFPVPLGRGLGVLLGAIAATVAQGQQINATRPAPVKAPPARIAEAPASVHKMVIFEGSHRRVHYITTGNLSTSDRLTAHELQRAENDLAYFSDLQSLKQQYVDSERMLEPYRRSVQQQLYGTQIRYGGSSSSYGSYGNGGWGNGYFYPRFGIFGNGATSFAGYAGSTSYAVTRSLQFGMGDEGRFKAAMVQGIARDSSPEYATAALRNYDAVLGRAASSSVLARDLSLQKGPATYSSYEPSYTKGGKVTLWVGTEKYMGTVKDDRAGWVVLQTDKGEVTVRKSEITRSEVTGK